MRRLSSITLPWLSCALAALACGSSSNGGAPGSGAPDGSGGALDGAGDDGAGDDGAGDDATAHDAADARADAKDASVADVIEAEAGPPAAHPPWPQVPPNAGTVFAHMKLVLVVTTGDPLGPNLLAFGDALASSQWWAAVGKDYGLGAPVSTVHVTGPAITTNPDQTAMESYIAGAIAGNAAAQPDGRTIYMLWLPPGIDAVDPRGPNTKCKYYGGYHTTYGSAGNAWGFGQRCDLTGTGLTDEQWLTIVGSHEIAEAASDPFPGSGYTLPTPDPSAPWTQVPWINSVDGEIGDLCFSTQITEGQYVYQRIWSNSAAAAEGDPCVPALAGRVYENASAPQGWYTVASGGSVQIPFTGFSEGAAPDWIISGALYTSSVTGFTSTLSSPTSTTIQGTTYATTNNGRAGTLTVTAPAAASGDWAIFFLYSQTLAAGGDPYHFWPVGVYIP